MIKVQNIIKPSPEQWESVVLGARNAMNSWDRSDSTICKLCINDDVKEGRCPIDNRNENIEKYFFNGCYVMGDNDLDLMQRLCRAGTEHRKYLRMIIVIMDITSPLYWWKEFDTYKVGTVTNSCSTMHKIHEKEFTLDDFSCEHLDIRSKPLLETIIDTLNGYRNLFVNYNADDYEVSGCPSKKDIWWQMIQLLPSSYNQKRTVMMNYETVFNIIKQRTGHKLDEWNEFVDILIDLPYVKELMQK